MIVREGLPFILIGLVVTTVLVLVAARWNNWVAFVLGLATALLTVFVIFFFRNPVRTIPDEAQVLVAPADGRVVAIDTLESQPFIGGQAIKVSIFLSIFDVHLNRIPAAGVIDYVKYNPGKFLAAYKDKASDVNEQTEIGMTSSSGHKLVFKQIAGIIARRIVCRLDEKETVSTGQRFGMIRFGSRTDLIIPSDSRLVVTKGQQVYGGETVMGYLSDGLATKSGTPAMKESDVEL